MTAVVKPLATLYEQDFTAWLDQQAALARADRSGELDLAHLAEELEAMAGSQRRELRSRQTKLLHHLLKCQVQPERWTPSWTLTIREQRREILALLEESPSLRRHGEQILARCYQDAREDAATETGLPPAAFPERCPWRLEQVLDPEFWPSSGHFGRRDVDQN